jgi:hypothetical protein
LRRRRATPVRSADFIAVDIKDEDCDGRGFSFRDPQGICGNVGPYGPWTAGR